MNENSDSKNKIVFDKKLSNFSFDDIALTHDNQKVEFKGFIDEKEVKDLNLNFTNIDINKLTPEVSDFTFKGILNGNVNLKQNNSIYQPTASLFIDNLNINKILLGKLNLDIAGDNELKKLPKEKNSEEFTDVLLYENDVFITPGTIFGSNGEGYIRASLCVEVDVLNEVLNRLTPVKI